jgi:cobyrinic acid a,c-diamide synthase
MNAQPRLVVSAPSSGHGKTAIAVGLLAAAVARGVTAAGFKVGPDHTDAAYLGLAAGRPGRNLDPRLVGAQRVAPLFAHGASGSQLAVIEGAMGLFDSLTGQPEIDGTAAVAATLRAPVVLVVDVAAMFDEMVHLGGVILNRIASPRHEQMLRTALDDIGMPVLGALRRGDLPNVLPARAHGPVPVAHRTVEASRAVRRLGEAVLSGLDLDRLIALANSAPALPGPLWTPAEAIGTEPFEQRPVIALAGGAGAPYTYVETAELLTAAGADVAVVDPLRDETLPAGTRALVVGAGLPEGYAEELSANRRLCSTVAKFAADGWPVVAEGVALPWLGHEFDGRLMCGVLDATAYTGEQTVAGYREATAPTTSVLAPGGARITGYKQHRAVVTPRAGAVPAWTWSGGNPEGFVWRQVHASQLGLHWAAAPEIAKRMVAAAIAGPASLQKPAPPMPPAAAAVAMSSPPPAMPTVGAAPVSEMPSQISGPEFGPPPVEVVPGRAEHRGAEFGPAFGPGSGPGEREYADPAPPDRGDSRAPEPAMAQRGPSEAGVRPMPGMPQDASMEAGPQAMPGMAQHVSMEAGPQAMPGLAQHVSMEAGPQAMPGMAQRALMEAGPQAPGSPPHRLGGSGPQSPGVARRGQFEGSPQRGPQEGQPMRGPQEAQPMRGPGEAGPQMAGAPPRGAVDGPPFGPGTPSWEPEGTASGMPSGMPLPEPEGHGRGMPLRESAGPGPGIPSRGPGPVFAPREQGPQVPGMPSRGPSQAGPQGPGLSERSPEPGLGERVAAEFGAVYGAHSNGIAVDFERSAGPGEHEGAERRSGARGPGSESLGDTVDITAP